MTPRQRKPKAAEPAIAPTWREVETNARTTVAYANRVATYASPFEVRIRFWIESGFAETSALYGKVNVRELTNSADMVLPAVVAKRLIVDLQNVINAIERCSGEAVPTGEELVKRWQDALKADGR